MRTQYISFQTVLQKCKICTQPSICKIFGSRNGFASQPSLCHSPSHRFFFSPAGIEVFRSSYIGTIELNRTPSILSTYLKQKYARFYLRACKSFKKSRHGTGLGRWTRGSNNQLSNPFLINFSSTSYRCKKKETHVCCVQPTMCR